MLPHKIRSRASRQRCVLDPSFTSITQAKIEADASPNAFCAETVSISRELKEVLSKNADNSHEISPLYNKLRAYHVCIEFLSRSLPSLSWFFTELASLVDTAIAEAREVHRQDLAKTQRITSMEQKLETAFERVRMLCTDEIKQTLANSDNRDKEITAVSDLCESLTARVKLLESENGDLRRSLKRMVSRDAEHDREADMRRSQLTELQSKSLVIVQENQYLRQICRHNRDLLDESSELREEIDRMSQSHKEEIEKLVREKGIAQREVDALAAALKHTSKQIDVVERELQGAKEALAQCEDELHHSMTKQHFFLGSHTPRPQRSSTLASAVQAACGLLGEPSKAISGLPTSEVEGNLHQLVVRLSELNAHLKAKTDTQSAVLEYLDYDDFEQMTRGVVSCITTYSGAAALPPSGGTGSTVTISRSLASMPLHARVSLGQGVWNTMGCLPHEPLSVGVGWIGIRTFSLEELILTMDDIRAERRQQPHLLSVGGTATTVTLLQHIRRYAHQRNSTSPCAQSEFLASMDYSMDLHCYSPVVDMFRRVLREQAFPEALHWEIIGSLDLLCKEVAALPAETLRVGVLGKNTARFLSRKALTTAVLKHFPFIGDSAMFRLRAIQQAEMQRLANQDSKLVSTIVAKDECVADILIGSPQGDDASGGSTFVVAAGVLQRSSSSSTQAAPFRRPLSSLLMPFSAALYRAAMDQYEAFALLVIGAVTEVCEPSGTASSENQQQSESRRIDFNRLHDVLAKFLGAGDVAKEFVECCRRMLLSGGEIVPLALVARCARCFYFPAHVRNRICADQKQEQESSMGSLDNLKVAEAAKKSVALLRTLQR